MLRILLIEDDLIDQMTVTRYLKKNIVSHRLEKATQVETARAFLTQQSFDLVISDMILPDGDAFDLACFFQKQTFVIFTGHLTDELRAKAQQLGVHKIAEKTHDFDHLKQLFEPTNTPSTSPSNSNIQRLLQLFDQKQQHVIEIIEVFLVENKKMLSELEEAHQKGDLRQVQMIAHKIKSGYKMMQFQKALELSEQLENETQPDTTTRQAYIEQIKFHTETLVPQLRQDLEQLKADYRSTSSSKN